MKFMTSKEAIEAGKKISKKTEALASVFFVKILT